MACLHCQKQLEDHDLFQSKVCLTWALDKIDVISQSDSRIIKELTAQVQNLKYERVDLLNKCKRQKKEELSAK